MAAAKTIPFGVFDTVLHVKVNESDEVVIMPVTRYDAILNAPKVATNISASSGSPFALLATESEIVDASELRKLIPDIV